jgi:hypothetical protein
LISSSELIQINATILAGLIVLFSIQTAITGKTEAISLLNRQDEIKLEIHTIDESLDKLCDSYSTNSRGAFYFTNDGGEKCDDLLWKKNHLSSELKTIDIALKNPNALNISDPYYLATLQNLAFLMFFIMIIPFSFSASAETILAIRKKEFGLAASKMSIISLIAGFITITIVMALSITGIISLF